MTAKGSRAFTYDNQGNEVTDATKTLGYNFDNLLTSYANGSTTTTYKYDASGNRIEKNQTGTGATNYQYVNSGNNQVMVTKNITAGTSNFNVYGVDLVSQGDSATTVRQYYLTDGLGNVRYLTNSSGITLNSYSTDPFGGNQTGTGTTANSYTYQAEQKDSESNLVYLRARYFDPSTGRFTSKDPSSGNLGNTATQNGYNYANNNPINMADPLGLAAQCGGTLPDSFTNKSYAGMPVMTDTSKSMVLAGSNKLFTSTISNIINAGGNAKDGYTVGATAGGVVGCAAGSIGSSLAFGLGTAPAGCVSGSKIGAPVVGALTGTYVFFFSLSHPQWQPGFSM